MTVETITCHSRIASAVVYARGAVVTRRVELPDELPNESFSLAVSGISPLAQPGSFRTQVEGTREVVGLRSELQLPEVTTFGGPVLEKLLDLGRARKLLETREAAAHKRHRVVSTISLKLGKRRQLRWHDPTRRVRDTLSISGLIDGRLAAIDAELLAIQRELEENAKALTEAEAEAAHARSEELAGVELPTRDLTILLSGGDGTLDDLLIEYNVGAARWWPAYSARLSDGGRRARLTLEAFIAQSTFEDWTDVAIGLCTADLTRDVRLPELASLRLGRAQAPKRRGFRPPPEGLDRLFAGYDQAMALAERRAAEQAEMEDIEDLLAEAEEEMAVFDEQDFDKSDYPAAEPAESAAFAASFDKPAVRAPGRLDDYVDLKQKSELMPPPSPQPMFGEAKRSAGLASMLAGAVLAPAAAGVEAVRSARERSKKGKRRQAKELASIGAAEEASELAPADSWLDFDHLHLAEPQSRSSRGRLQHQPLDDLGDRVESAAALVEALEPPRMAVNPRRSAGEFDYRYDARATVDVPSDGAIHRVTLAQAEADAQMSFRSVPREAEEVYREVTLTNPFDGPMLSGPADVFLDGALITTSKIDSVDRGGRVRFGLGQEERLRVARNTQTAESTHGLLGGATTVDHTVTVEIASALGTDTTVDVIDRIPVTDDDDVSVVVRSTSPSFEKYDQSERGEPLRGGRLWRLEIPAGGKSKLTYVYRIELPSKCELVGGNRRE